MSAKTLAKIQMSKIIVLISTIFVQDLVSRLRLAVHDKTRVSQILMQAFSRIETEMIHIYIYPPPLAEEIFLYPI